MKLTGRGMAAGPGLRSQATLSWEFLFTGSFPHPTIIEPLLGARRHCRPLLKQRVRQAISPRAGRSQTHKKGALHDLGQMATSVAVT